MNHPSVYIIVGGCIMQDEKKLLEDIESILPEIISAQIPLKENESLTWWERLKSDYYHNAVLLSFIIKRLRDKGHHYIDEEELLYMQKLYKTYPQNPPKDLLNCPWPIVKILINILTEEKRLFYLRLYLKYNLTSEELITYITHDIYEKYIYVLSRIEDYNVIEKEDIINKLLEIELYLCKNN